ncbi:c-type cytochrome [Pararhodobacter marinus]|uniref:Cytochrome C554 n=1 Tax=Pararhodobacter marinus TaxID=2184063 RepID=A0A2U2CGF2_9RHOB|nr:cytochrome c [Pararhodobacter marinus]PWE30922.1 cytochrome C554 [Pararhodobacter marinus]
MFRYLSAAAIAAATLLPGLAQAQEATDPNVTARHAMMQLYAYNLGVLGGMAQARIEYDPELATEAATAIYHVSMAHADRMWPEGTEAGATEDSRALPAIWENRAEFDAAAEALTAAAESAMGTVGTDLASLQAGVGGIGQSCSGCHRTFRQPE